MALNGHNITMLAMTISEPIGHKWVMKMCFCSAGCAYYTFDTFPFWEWFVCKFVNLNQVRWMSWLQLVLNIGIWLICSYNNSFITECWILILSVSQRNLFRIGYKVNVQTRIVRRKNLASLVDRLIVIKYETIQAVIEVKIDDTIYGQLVQPAMFAISD